MTCENVVRKNIRNKFRDFLKNVRTHVWWNDPQGPLAERRRPSGTFSPSRPEAMLYRSSRSITRRNGLLLDLGIVSSFAEILNVLNKGSGEDCLDVLRIE